MQTAVEGIYRNEKVKLMGTTKGIAEEARVVLSTDIDRRAHGIDPEQAAGLRARLMSFAEDWEQPEMDIYDDYDAAKIGLSPADTSPCGTR